MIRFFILLLPIAIFAQEITLQWLKDKPRSLYKDFYIYRYLAQDITPDQADEALYQSSRINHRMLRKWVKKSDDIDAKEYYRCASLKLEDIDIAKESVDCITTAISPIKAKKLNKKARNKIIAKIKSTYPIVADTVAVMGSKTPFSELITKDKEVFFEVFNRSGYSFRDKYLNRTIPTRLLDKIKDDRKFERSIALIVTDSMLDKLHKSILGIDSKSYSHETNFFLAINAAKYHDNKQALAYLDIADKKAYFQFDKDKVLFWKYLLTKDELYLMKLSNSWDINIYSYFAMEKLGVEPSNLVTEIKYKKKKSNFDVTDPFAWLPILEDSRRIDDKKMLGYFKKFSTPDTLPHLSLLLEKANSYKKAYFIMPYGEYLSDMSDDQKAMVYAIGRQESRFIPSSISTSYAMGIMQFLPSTSKILADQRDEFYDIDSMFTPKKSLQYGNHYLSYLKDNLQHPLLVAYAYNGGIGRITRLLKREVFFKSNHNLEPYISLELIPYSEPRRYGKKVLLNYIIYKKLLNQPITLKSMLDSVSNKF
jgi:soluble lytic murein transglycosylase